MLVNISRTVNLTKFWAIRVIKEDLCTHTKRCIGECVCFDEPSPCDIASVLDKYPDGDFASVVENYKIVGKNK